MKYLQLSQGIPILFWFFNNTSVIFIGTIQGILGSMPPQCKECTFLHLLLNFKSPCFITITVFSDVNFLTLLYIPKYKCFLSHTFLECVILHLGQCLLLIISKVQQYSTCLTLGRHPLWVVPPDKQNTFSEYLEHFEIFRLKELKIQFLRTV